MSKRRTKNPGYKKGDHWVVDDVDGATIRSSDAKKTWDNKVVHKRNFEPRHPQEFVRGLPDNTAPRGLVRPQPADILIERPILEAPAIAGLAVAGVSISGDTEILREPVLIPPGTFNENTL
jgi:hypothetical protein